MNEQYIEGYVKGVVEMASELSGLTGPSSMTAKLFGVADLGAELIEAFGFEPDFEAREVSEVTLMEIFTNWITDGTGNPFYVRKRFSLKKKVQRYKVHRPLSHPVLSLQISQFFLLH